MRDGNVVTGEQARSQARLLPRQTLSRFWQRLGLTPLPSPLGSVRHHADLGYAHLQHLHENAAKPEALLCVVPGSFDREQLGVLLGIIEQCPFRASGLVDSAVAASVFARGQGPALHLDVQLHQAVITHLDIGDSVTRQQVDIIADTGIVQLHDAWAKLIAQAFIQQCRFDPLHDAKTEQRLYDSLNQWIGNFTDNNEQMVQLEAGGTTHQAKLTRSEFLHAAEPVYRQWHHRFAEAGSVLRLLSHRVAALPGFHTEVKFAQVLSAEAAFEACLSLRELLESDASELHFVTRLPHQGDKNTVTGADPVATAPSVAPLADGATTSTAMPTHVLSNSDAHAIPDSGLYLMSNGQTDGNIRFDLLPPNHSTAVLRRNAGTIYLDVPADVSLLVNGQACVGTRAMSSGDRLSIEGHDTVELIRVIRDGT